MEHYTISRRKSCIVLLLSCLLHVIIMLLFFKQSISQWHKDAFTLQQEIDDETYVAHQLLSAGQEAATVIFQDEAPSGNAPIAMQEEAEEQTAEETEQLVEEAPQEPDKELPEEPQDEETTIAEPSPSQLRTEQPQAKPRPRVKKKKARKKRTNNKQNITFADISRGFMRSMQQEAGYNAATNNMKDVALQLYTSKIWHIIKNAFVASDTNLHLPQAVSAHTQLVLTIDRSGKLVHIHLDYPKHIQALRTIERLLISRTHQAGLFPPLPANVKGATKTFSFPLYIQGESGFHNYSIGYR